MQGDEERQRLLPPTMVAGHSLSDLGLAPEPGRGRGASCRRRYLALVLFSWFAFSQGLARSISLAMEDDLVVKNTNRLLLSSWSAVGFLAFPVLMYLMDKHGLRTSLIAALFALLLGSGLRCIPSAPPGAQTWLVHSSQLLIAIAGPSAIAAAPFISSTWFPQDERSIATAIGALANYLGAASAFLMQSFLIDSGNGLATRGLKLLSHRSMETIIFNRMQIMLYVEFGMIAVLFVLVVLLMPRHPLLYPSTSAATRRLHYTEAIPRLLRRPSFWLAVAVYAFPLGVSSAWLKQLGSMFKLHFSSTVVGWAELAAVLAGYLGALAVARCSDNFTGRLKVIVLTLLSGATLSAVWFTISCLGKISFLALSTVNLLVTCVLFGAFMVGAIPLLLELLVEVTFPVPEGLSCGLAAFVSIACITLPINVVAASSLDLTWLSWALVGGCALGALGILLLPESYGRLHMDVILSV